MDTAIDRIPVASLPDRYKIGKTALYERIKNLNIKLIKESNRSYITPADIKLLDRLNNHILEGGTTPDFVRAHVHPEQGEQTSMPTPEPIAYPEHSELDRSPRTFTLNTPNTPNWLMLVEAIVERIQPPIAPADPLAPQRHLEEIAVNQWVVSTAQLREILGTTPQPGERFGFVFTKCGRAGRQSAWRVMRSIDRENKVDSE